MEEKCDICGKEAIHETLDTRGIDKGAEFLHREIIEGSRRVTIMNLREEHG